MFGLTGQSCLGVIGFIISQIIVLNLSVDWASNSSTDLASNLSIDLASNSSNELRVETCSTPACERAASLIIKSMDESVEPCSNFYQFACGNFLKTSVVPEGELLVNYFLKMQNKVLDQLHSAIENGIADDDPQTFKKLKSFYNVCMDTDWIEKNSVAEFKEILNKLGGWPLLAGSSWNETDFEWRSTMLEFRKVGFKSRQFLDITVEKDLKNHTRRMVHVKQARFGIDQKYLAEGYSNELIKAYFVYMVSFAELLGVNRNLAIVQLAPAIALESNISKIAPSSDQMSNMTNLYNPMTVAELQQNYPLSNNGPNWLDLLNGILQPQASLRDDDTVIVESPSYLKGLLKLLDETPKRVQANLAFWSAARFAAERLTEPFRQAQKRFLDLTVGENIQEPRWEYCINKVYDNMHVAIGSLYVRRHVPRGIKENATELITDIIRSSKNILEKANWMDEKTKKSALEKLEGINLMIAYPDEFLDDEKLDNYYKELKIDPKSFLQSSLNLNVFHRRLANEKLDKPVNRSDWTHHSDTIVINSFYMFKDNVIVIPAAMLQERFFDKDHSMFMNYAALGSSAGHEMMHGFDNKGRQYDKHGNWLNWWDPDTEKEYLKRISCIKEQFTNYTLKTFNVTDAPLSSQKQNLADNYGVKEAYYAYEDWEKRNGPEPRLPGLEKYSTRQLFWMSFAGMWCSNFPFEELQRSVQYGMYTPDEFRVNGPLWNNIEFARDFNCSKGSPMNPENKCMVW